MMIVLLPYPFPLIDRSASALPLHLPAEFTGLRFLFAVLFCSQANFLLTYRKIYLKADLSLH